MSLVMTSSNWTSSDQTKKRVPTIRKTINKSFPSSSLEVEEFNSIDSLYNNGDKIDGDSEAQTNRNLKVTDMINKMSSFKTNDDGDYLENFTPISHPDSETSPPDEDTILPSDYSMKRHHVTNSNFTPDDTARSVNIQSDFNRIYDVSTSKPHYTSGIGLGKDLNHNNKVTDRLSYIVHLLEQQQNEKTNNVLEEYVLYILLGTFVIFVVDSFSRGGRYIR